MKKALKIYVASSWRNTYQPSVVRALRGDGHLVYDFRCPEPNNDGFRWSEIDPRWETWDVDQYAASLNHPIAQHGFALDLGAVLDADLCILVLPSGRSASFEYGYQCARSGRPGLVYMPERCEPELMYLGSTFVDTLPRLVDAARAIADQPDVLTTAEQFHVSVVEGWRPPGVAGKPYGWNG